MTQDLRTLVKAMRDAQEAYFNSPELHDRKAFRAYVEAQNTFYAALAEPAPAPDVAELVRDLRERASIAREEGNETARSDAWYFEQSADLLETIARERDEALVSERNLGNLLARIHRDGGHYQETRGTLKACVDADLVVSELLAKADALAAAEARVKALREALDAITREIALAKIDTTEMLG